MAAARGTKRLLGVVRFPSLSRATKRTRRSPKSGSIPEKHKQYLYSDDKHELARQVHRGERQRPSPWQM